MSRPYPVLNFTLNSLVSISSQLVNMAASSPLINEVNASDTEFSDREQSLEFNAQEVLQIDEV